MGENETGLSLVSIDHGVLEVLGAVRDRIFPQSNSEMSKIEKQSILFPSTIVESVEQLLYNLRSEMNEVDNIVLCGDPSQMAEAQKVLKSYFN